MVISHCVGLLSIYVYVWTKVEIYFQKANDSLVNLSVFRAFLRVRKTAFA